MHICFANKVAKPQLIWQSKTVMNPKVFLLFFSWPFLALAQQQDPTTIDIQGLGYIKGKEIYTVGYNNNPPKTYHSYRNLKFGEAVRFQVWSHFLATTKNNLSIFLKQEPVDANETYSNDRENPTDKSKDGPICQQGSLNRFELMVLNKLKMEDVIGLVIKVHIQYPIGSFMIIVQHLLFLATEHIINPVAPTHHR